MRSDYRTTQLGGITDLTLLAEIEDGFVVGPFETETKVERLRRVLAVVNSIRQVSREVSLQPSPFADAVGQFQSIHFFRYAIVPPDLMQPVAAAKSEPVSAQEPANREQPVPAPHPGPHRLFLNVTFDGGWEPYMRIIWGPLGRLLDLIFCHCVGYPLASKSPFSEYMDWVRSHEIPSGLFYADGAATVADQNYLARIEALQREHGGRADADAIVGGLALPGRPAAAIATRQAVETALLALKALAGLRPLFPTNTEDDDGVLLRFARESLREFREWIEQGLFDPGQDYDHLRASFEDERKWLMTPQIAPAADPPRLQFALSDVQAGIARGFDLPQRVIHGALVLLQITDADEALAYLASAQVTRGDEKVDDGGHAFTLALTYAGLARLGVPESQLGKLPREFIEGMETRAGILGDVRGNHPLRWKRPQRNWPGSQAAPPIELSSVHVLVQLRTAQQPDDEQTDGLTLLARLQPAVRALQGNTGLRVLSVQPMRQRPPENGQRNGRDNFGFVDGISQPSLDAAAQEPAYWSDRVKFGELFLGHANDRGDDQPKDADELLDNGSFLVVRKLRQHVDRLEQIVDAAATRIAPNHVQEVKEVLRCKLLGRGSDGKPLVETAGPDENDFDYRSDSDGAACPFASHVRRANPREPRPHQMPPRITRRGMSYGQVPTAARPGTEHGLMFMAYNASIAEQFETIQRWLAGGNSSGVSSALADPFVGVPEVGSSRVYRFVHNGQVLRLDLGDQPLAVLEWGVYAFVPSIAALEALPKIVYGAANEEPATAPADKPKQARSVDDEPEVPAEDADKDAWRQLLEDGRSRDKAWAYVRARGGVVRTNYGVLVGSPEAVLEVLQNPGDRFSVSGYGERMEQSIGEVVKHEGGRGYLGQDDVGPNAGHELPYVEQVNQAIENTIPESQIYEAARDAAQEWLKVRLPQELPPPRRVPISLGAFAGDVIAKLCFEWFGLPDLPEQEFVKRGMRSDKAHTDKPLCPGHLLAASRYIFSPHVTEAVEDLAKPQGGDYVRAVQAFLDRGVKTPAPLTRKILEVTPADPPDLRARTVAGVMLGFPPTVIGNLVTVLMAWTATRRLWDIQQDLFALKATDSELGHATVVRALQGTLLATMTRSPVPYMDWRKAKAGAELGGIHLREGETVVLGLGSAVQVREPDPMLMFGGARTGNGKTIHACPGYRMAVCVMLGCITALLTAGALQSTPDPRQLTLIG